MHNYDLILTLTGGLTAALVLGYITQRLGLSPIVGYLLAGTLVGPHTPGFVANGEIAEQLAEVGVILLMFGVGLHFHLSDLLAVRRVAIPGAIAQSAVATLLGAIIARWFGWSWPAGIVFGMALAVASTTSSSASRDTGALSGTGSTIRTRRRNCSRKEILAGPSVNFARNVCSSSSSRGCEVTTVQEPNARTRTS